MPSAQGVIDHLANFHDTPWIGPIRTVHFDAEDDVVVLEPGGLFGGTDFGVIRRGNAIAGLVGGIIRTVIDQHTAP